MFESAWLVDSLKSKNWEDVQAQVGDSHEQRRRKKSPDTTKKGQKFGLHLARLEINLSQTIFLPEFLAHTTQLLGS